MTVPVPMYRHFLRKKYSDYVVHSMFTNILPVFVETIDKSDYNISCW